jgi:hypothetical protein
MNALKENAELKQFITHEVEDSLVEVIKAHDLGLISLNRACIATQQTLLSCSSCIDSKLSKLRKD